MSFFCEPHRLGYRGYTEGQVGGSECPICVREERDRLRELIPQAWMAGSAHGENDSAFEKWMKQKGLT